MTGCTTLHPCFIPPARLHINDLTYTRYRDFSSRFNGCIRVHRDSNRADTASLGLGVMISNLYSGTNTTVRFTSTTKRGKNSHQIHTKSKPKHLLHMYLDRTVHRYAISRPILRLKWAYTLLYTPMNTRYLKRMRRDLPTLIVD